MPKISIIVPCYNVEKYLPQCLDSLTGQTLRDIEIIMVDDGSPDGSGAICDRYAGKDSRVKVIHKRNGGVSAARNDGLAAATGEYVFFCDGDDWMPLDACQLLWEEAERTGADVIFGDIWRSWETRDEYMRLFQQTFCSEDPEFLQELIRTNFYYTYCPLVPLKDRADGCYGGPWNKIVKRQMLAQAQIVFDLRVKGIYDDVIFSAYVLAAARKVAYIGKPVYNYRQVPTSMTRVFKKNILDINAAIFESWEEFLRAYDRKGELRKVYAANVIRRLDHAVRVYFMTPANPLPEGERKRELSRLMKTEPYRTSARDVEPRMLTKRHRILTYMTRLGWGGGVWMAYRYNDWKKKRKK